MNSLFMLIPDSSFTVFNVSNGGNSGLMPIFSSGIVVLIFAATTYINYRIRKWDRLRGWNMKTFVEPNIEVIKEFYDDTKDLVSKGIRKCQSVTNDTFSAQAKVQAKINEEFQNRKRKFELDFVQIVELSHNFKSGNSLSRIVWDLEDMFVTFFDKKEFDENSKLSIENRISINRSELLSRLFTMVN